MAASAMEIDSPASKLLRKRKADAAICVSDDEGEAKAPASSGSAAASASASASATSTFNAPVSAAAKRRAASAGKPYKKMAPQEQKAYRYKEVADALRDKAHYLRKDAEDDLKLQEKQKAETIARLTKKLAEAGKKNDTKEAKKIAEKIKTCNAQFRAVVKAHQSRVNREYLDGVLHNLLVQEERNPKRAKYADSDSSSDSDSDDDDDDDEKRDPDDTETETDPDLWDANDDPDSESGDDCDATGDVKMSTGAKDVNPKKSVSKATQLALSDEQAMKALDYYAGTIGVTEKAVHAAQTVIVEAAKKIWTLTGMECPPIVDVDIPSAANAAVRVRTPAGAAGPVITQSMYKVALKTQDTLIDMLSSINEFTTPGLEDRIALDEIDGPLRAVHAMYILMDNADERMRMAADPYSFGKMEELLFSKRLSLLRLAFTSVAPSLVCNLSVSARDGEVVQIHDLVLQYLLPQFLNYYAVSLDTTVQSLREQELMDLFERNGEIAALCKTRSRAVPRSREDPVVWLEEILPARTEKEFIQHRRVLGEILKLPVTQLVMQSLSDRRNSVLIALKDFHFRREYLSGEALRIVEKRKELVARKALCPADATDSDVKMKDADDGHSLMVSSACMFESLERLAEDLKQQPSARLAGFSDVEAKLLKTAIPGLLVDSLCRILKVPDIASMPSTNAGGGAVSTDVKFYEPSVFYENEAKRHDEVLKAEDAAENARHMEERRQRKANTTVLTIAQQKSELRNALSAQNKRRAQESDVRNMILDGDDE